MNKLTFYEQVGIVIPGSVLVFGLLFFFPALQTVLTREGVSLGDLGIFVLLSYAAGHLIAAIGNLGESLFWGVLGGMPTDWITKTTTTLLSSSQIDLLEKKPNHLLMHAWSFAVLARKLSLQALRQKRRPRWWWETRPNFPPQLAQRFSNLVMRLSSVGRLATPCCQGAREHGDEFGRIV
jgi:hypothetical protein